MMQALRAPDVDVLGANLPGAPVILTPEALEFLASIERRFRDHRALLLDARRRRQREFDAGARPDFLEETAEIRRRDWKVDPCPDDLRDRRVEITGPVDRKMIINALNSGAKVFMADFEDATSPSWTNIIEGQINLHDAVRGTIRFTSDEGRLYILKDEIATLVVRPRGWHLVERNVLVDGQPVSASIFDFALFLFHNAAALIEKGSGPYFYLPKLESHLEARLWNDVFEFAQDELGIPRGTIKATVLIETITAAFEMDEILYELRRHSCGLNCGRWDYIFSFIKKFRESPACVLPDRALVTMETHFLRSYSKLAIRTCHRRGTHAIGGMAAQIPIRNDREADGLATRKVVDDKLREVRDGHDGTWVAHPGLVPIATHVFDDHMAEPNQIAREGASEPITAEDLLAVPEGPITEAGLRTNLRVGVQYLAAWLRGQGAVPLHHLMEDAATAEISRAQVWQWLHHPDVALKDGRAVTRDLVERLLEEELEEIEREVGGARFADERYRLASTLFKELVLADDFAEFLTLSAYEHL